MAVYEWIVVAYFAGLTLVAWRGEAAPKRRGQATALGVVVVLTVFGVASMQVLAVRAWLPHVYLFAGYWMPALLVTPAREQLFEGWLTRSDVVLRQWLPVVPPRLMPLLELAYLICYPLVPLSFAIVWIKGASADVERFWLAVLLAGYTCYVTLPWLISRPPRARDHQHDVSHRGLRSFNARVLERWSHQFNTFPSGHVAVTAAAAAAVASVSGLAGAMLGVVVGAIAIGAAAGGYHYVIDVILGLIVAAAAVAVAGVL
jgi:hypothetical protein